MGQVKSLIDIYKFQIPKFKQFISISSVYEHQILLIFTLRHL